MANYEIIVREGYLWGLLEEGNSYHLTNAGKHLIKDIVNILKDNEVVFEKYSGKFKSLIGSQKAYIETFVEDFNQFPKEISDKINRYAIRIAETTNVSYESVIGFIGFYSLRETGNPALSVMK